MSKAIYNSKGEVVGYYEMIDWWLENYKGMEHLFINPETMYTVNSILERCFNKLKELREK